MLLGIVGYVLDMAVIDWWRGSRPLRVQIEKIQDLDTKAVGFMRNDRNFLPSLTPLPPTITFQLTTKPEGRMPGVELMFFHTKHEDPALTSPVCSERQWFRVQDVARPRLKAKPGAHLMGFYMENGHVSLDPQNPERKWGTGRIYWYGTTSTRKDITVAEVLQWPSVTGKSVDKNGGTGTLLSSSMFDDGRCSEKNGTPFANKRWAASGNADDTNLCRGNLTLPSDLKPGTVYSLIWLWNWGPDKIPGKPITEAYTTCLDIDII